MFHTGVVLLRYEIYGTDLEYVLYELDLYTESLLDLCKSIDRR